VPTNHPVTAIRWTAFSRYVRAFESGRKSDILVVLFTNPIEEEAAQDEPDC